MIITIGTISNIYGQLHVKEEHDKYYWSIEDHDTHHWEEIPKTLYNKLIAFEKKRVKEYKKLK